MKNKPRLFLYFLAASLLFWISSTSVTAAPLVSIGDNTDIFFNGSSSLRWSSNLFRNEENEESDSSWVVSPGFEINVGRGISNADLTIVTRYDDVRYQDNTQLDTELFHIEALGSYATTRLNVNGSASFDESKINTEQGNVEDDLVEVNRTAGDLDAEYRVSPKFSFSAGVRYKETEYQTYKDRLVDRETTSFPLNVYYELTPKLDLTLGYTHSTSDIEGTSSSFASIDVINEGLPDQEVRGIITDIVKTGHDRDSHFFNIGFRGNILTKLTGYIKAGYRTRNVSDSTITSTPSIVSVNGVVIDSPTEEDSEPSSTDRSEMGMFGLDVNLTWMATSKLFLQTSLSRDFGAGGEGESTEITSANLIGNYSMNEQWSAMANIGYTTTDYSNFRRGEEQLNGGLRVTYVLNQLCRFTAGYTYSENDSNLANSSYESNTLDLTAIFRY